MNYTKLEEILHKEAGNIRVRCLTEKEFIKQYTSLISCVSPLNRKLKSAFEEKEESLKTFDDIRRFFEENKPSKMSSFIDWLQGDFTYSQKLNRINSCRDEYEAYVKLHTTDVALFQNELNKGNQTVWDYIRLNAEEKRFEALCQKHFNSNESLIVLAFDIRSVNYTKNDAITIVFEGRSRDVGVTIELPEKYYKELEWDK